MTTFINDYNLVLNDLIVGRVYAINGQGTSDANPLNTVGEKVQTAPLKPPSIPVIGANNSHT
jgi:hypothetical protein